MTKSELRIELLNLQKRGMQIQQMILLGQPLRNSSEYASWISSVSLFANRHLQNHPMKKDIDDAYFFRNNEQKGLSAMLGLLDVIGKDDEFWNEDIPQSTSIPSYFLPQQTPSFWPQPIPSVYATANTQMSSQNAENINIAKDNNKKVFIVHGHDTASKIEMARTLEKIGLDAIILHEQADSGMTIIEKIEAYSDVAFAVVLYTECDLGRAKEESVDREQYRARQNVVFEHGYLIGKLGRDKVCALVKGDVETPGDISGVVYTKMDDNGAWKLLLARNLKAAGIEFDASTIL